MHRLPFRQLVLHRKMLHLPPKLFFSKRKFTQKTPLNPYANWILNHVGKHTKTYHLVTFYGGTSHEIRRKAQGICN